MLREESRKTIGTPAGGTRVSCVTERVKLIGPVIFIMALILFPTTGMAQVTFRVDGYVHDSETGNPLYAIVVIEGTKSGAMCDEKGHFSLEVADTGTFMLKISMISYEERRLGVHVPLKEALLILLAPQPINIAEVSVTSSTIIDKYSSSEKAITKMEVYRLPGIGADIVYASLMLPGLNSYPDAAMILARGGAQDETAIYFDGIKIKHPFRFDSPIYGGNFSILSNEIIRTSYISQGGVPVKYDNVLSGVLDLSSEDKVSGNQLPARRRTRFGRRVHRDQDPERKNIRPRQRQLHGHEIVLQGQSTPAGHDRPSLRQRVLPQAYAGYRGAQSVCSRPVRG